MLNELDLPDAMVQDGLALARLMEDERTWPVLERLFAKLNEDAIGQWTDDEDGKHGKKWLRGYRDCLVDIRRRIEETARLSVNHVEAKKQAEAVKAIRLDEGIGAGDMAVA